MTMRDRIIVIVFALAIVLYGGYKLLWIPAVADIARLEKSKTEALGLAADITPVLKQTESLQDEDSKLQKDVSDIKETDGATITKEEFLLCLGESTEKNNVKLTGFNDLGVQNEDGIYKAIFDFELQGTAYSINSILTDIDNIGIKYSVGSVSYRQVAEYDYLKRFFDSITGLPWYKEPEKKEDEILPDAELPTIDDALGDVFTDLPGLLLPPAVNDVPLPEQQTPQQEPIPAPEQTPTPTPPPEDRNINDRLDDLLKETSNTQKYKVVFLTNTENSENFDVGREMRLAVTVCFVMFEEPNLTNSYRTKSAEVL